MLGIVNVDQRGRRGRRHLDGNEPGAGVYVIPVSLSVRPADAEELADIGSGNRSEGLRKLLEMYRNLKQQNGQ